MKSKFLVVAALVLAAPLSAFAESDRMSDMRYIAASQCLAYAELPQLAADTFDTTALKQAVEAQSVGLIARNRADDVASDAQRAGRRAGDDERSVRSLRDRRDDACSNFVSTGLVQASATTPAS